MNRGDVVAVDWPFSDVETAAYCLVKSQGRT